MIDISHFKKLLEGEKARLEHDLGELGTKNPDDKKDWEATPGDFEAEHSDPIDVADKFEEFGERAATEYPLEKRLEAVTAALARMSDGTYGNCVIGGNIHPIEPERLEANPAAEECIAHLDHKTL